MSWLPRSISNSLRNDDEDDQGKDKDKEEDKDEKNDESDFSPNPKLEEEEEEEEDDEEEDEEDRAGRGVKDDLSEFRETITRQLWGVASFLAPPPPPPPPPPSSHRIDRSVADPNRWEPHDHSCSESGEDSDEEVSDGFRIGVLNQGRNQQVWKIDASSSMMPFEREDPVVDAVGVTEEVLAFAMNIAHHPETWLDFPLEEEEDIDDFDMSDAQYKHSLGIQHLAPRLAALRIELCPAHMSDGYFWKVYFVLLHSRLNKQDAELLSTPQIVSARAIWMQELQKRSKEQTDWFGRGNSDVKEIVNAGNESCDHVVSDYYPRNISFGTSAFQSRTYSLTTEFETEKHPVVDTQMLFVDKVVIEEEPAMKTENKDVEAGPSFKVSAQNFEDDDDDDDWLKEDSELEGYNTSAILVGHDEDVSFSDLEDDEYDCTMPVKSKIVSVGLDTPKRATQR